MDENHFTFLSFAKQVLFVCMKIPKTLFSFILLVVFLDVMNAD